MQVDPDRPAEAALETAVTTLREGGVLLYPTDTIYGLGCDPDCPRALNRLLRLKGRSAQKGLLLLIPGPTHLSRFAKSVPPEALSLLDTFWPGPLTILLEAVPGLPAELQGDSCKIGLRWPDTPLLRALLSRWQKGLVSTSANLSGQPYREDPAVLGADFASLVDLYLDAGWLRPQPASTIVDMTVRPFTVVRRGILAERVEEVIGKL